MEHLFADKETLAIGLEEFLLGGLHLFKQDSLLMFDLVDILKEF
jgi:hypothetical protein